ncbi:MAG: hypothetical protein V3571_00025 [Pseudodesulfovibrio sp.]
MADERRTLDFLQNDYYAHLEIHAEHYRMRLDEVRRAAGKTWLTKKIYFLIVSKA